MTETNPYPDLSHVASQDDVSTKGRGNFQADYINWAKTMQMMREHAPGWLPDTMDINEDMVHRAPDGTGYLQIFFRHADGRTTPCVPHAIMDHAMKAKKNIDARDVSDAFVRGACKAAALQFGLAWQMWSKDDPMERDEGPETITSHVNNTTVTKTPGGGTSSVHKPEPYEDEYAANLAIGQCNSQNELDDVGIRISASHFKGPEKSRLGKVWLDRQRALTQEQ